MPKRVPHFDFWVDPARITDITLERANRTDAKDRVQIGWDDFTTEGARVTETFDAGLGDDIARNVAEWIERETAPAIQPPEPPVEDEAVKKAGENLTAVATWWAEKGMANFKPFRVFFEQARAVELAAKGMDWEVPE